MRLRSHAFFCLVATAFAASSASAAHHKPFTRADAADIVREVYKITSPNGIDETKEIDIGGTRQWISVRGRDLRNPVLLFLHGGPASPEMPTRWTFQSGWEDYFTVVQWDQRGAGKTYDANDPKKIGPTLTVPRMVEDAAEVVQYLRQTYHRDKIFVIGHSWGTAVGLSLAHEHPEWLYAYVGMGQIVDMRAGERAGYDWTLAEAERRGNAKAIAELKSIAPYPEADGTLPLEKTNTERKWSMGFGGLTYGRDSFDYYSNAAKLSPDYSDADIAAIDRGSELSLSPLLKGLAKFDYSNVTDFRCPIVMFEGRHDETTPSDVVAEWMARVNAPAKKLVWFENSAHMIQIEQPGAVLVHLVEDVRPLAGKDAPRAP